MNTDPLSSILSLVDARVVYAGGLRAGGDWAVRFPPPDKIKFFVVAKGGCVLSVDGVDEPFRLRTGDVFLLSAPRGFVLASGPGIPPIGTDGIYRPGGPVIAEVGSGEEFLMLGSHVDVDSGVGRLLVDNMPSSLHLKADAAPAPRLRWLIGELVEEANSVTPGAGLAQSGLAHLMFLQILRAYLARSDGVEVGWLRAVCDPRLAPALRLMHSDPARNWHLPELAKAAAMSRTAFATRFKAVAGMAPLAYLTEWRMRLAEKKLRLENTPVAELARELGYSSEAAFSSAFKRVTGRSPKRGRAVPSIEVAAAN
ncbi:AraC family transcriptional regulator [Pseudomonas sp. R2.Fl]|nr:AraC family transcriptional regulator [Pseudomonas sp. R2.Fl]